MLGSLAVRFGSALFEPAVTRVWQILFGGAIFELVRVTVWRDLLGLFAVRFGSAFFRTNGDEGLADALW